MEKFFSLNSKKVKILRDRKVNIDNASEEKNLLNKYNYLVCQIKLEKCKPDTFSKKTSRGVL